MRGLLVVLVSIAVGAVWWLALPPGNSLPELQPLQVVGGKGFTPGKFLKPRAIAVDIEGNFYVADRKGYINYFDARGQVVRRWEMPVSRCAERSRMTRALAWSGLGRSAPVQKA